MKPNAREMTAIVASRSKMAKHNPKPATAGEKIAKSIWFVVSDKQVEANARRIDRAIARAVRKVAGERDRAVMKERERCQYWIAHIALEGLPLAKLAQMIAWGREPER